MGGFNASRDLLEFDDESSDSYNSLRKLPELESVDVGGIRRRLAMSPSRRFRKYLTSSTAVQVNIANIDTTVTDSNARHPEGTAVSSDKTSSDDERAAVQEKECMRGDAAQEESQSDDEATKARAARFYTIADYFPTRDTPASIDADNVVASCEGSGSDGEKRLLAAIVKKLNLKIDTRVGSDSEKHISEPTIYYTVFDRIPVLARLNAHLSNMDRDYIASYRNFIADYVEAFKPVDADATSDKDALFYNF